VPQIGPPSWSLRPRARSRPRCLQQFRPAALGSAARGAEGEKREDWGRREEGVVRGRCAIHLSSVAAHVSGSLVRDVYVSVRQCRRCRSPTVTTWCAIVALCGCDLVAALYALALAVCAAGTSPRVRTCCVYISNFFFCLLS